MSFGAGAKGCRQGQRQRLTTVITQTVTLDQLSAMHATKPLNTQSHTQHKTCAATRCMQRGFQFGRADKASVSQFYTSRQGSPVRTWVDTLSYMPRSSAKEVIHKHEHQTCYLLVATAKNVHESRGCKQ